MEDLYAIVNFTKQAHWKWRKRQAFKLDKWLLLEPILTEWRERHPSMGLKKLYHKIAPDFVGINQFIDYCMLNGFQAISYKKVPKTSTSGKKKHYPNLLRDLKISGINQVWVSDTTYYKLRRKWYFLTFIMDLYSRRIIGYHACDRLFAKANLAALQMAINQRGIQDFENKLIHQSDRGSQFKSKEYTDALKNAGIKISMGLIVYDNIHSERTHQTIKGEYLKHRAIQNEKELLFHLQKDVRLYNEERPHLSLNQMSPIEFECYLSNIPLANRTLMQVFAAKKRKTKNTKSADFVDPNQLKLQF